MSGELLVRPLEVGEGSGAHQGMGAGRSQRWTLNRPGRRNALSPAMVEALHEALHRAEEDGVDVVVLDGNGPSFCAGADLHYLRSHDRARAETPRHFLERIWDLTIAMEASPVVLIAALHGHAVAGGLELALACDIVIAAEHTLIGDGHVANNLLPGGGSSARLERALGRGASSWLALTGTFLPADDLAFAPWLHRVVRIDELETASQQAARTVMSSARHARVGFKALLNQQRPAPTAADRDAELDAFARHWIDHDVAASLQLFLDKRSGKAS